MSATLKSTLPNLFFNTMLCFQNVMVIINKLKSLRGLIQQSFISYARGLVLLAERWGLGEMVGFCSTKLGSGKFHHLEIHHNRGNRYMRTYTYSYCWHLGVTYITSTHRPLTRINLLVLTYCTKPGTVKGVFDMQ